MSRYIDRHHAGRVLADILASRYARESHVAVLALPRGGVPVGFEVAMRLGAPLDVFVVRKLGMPGQEELAIGAVASGGVRVLNESLVAGLRIPRAVIDSVAAVEGAAGRLGSRLHPGRRWPRDRLDDASGGSWAQAEETEAPGGRRSDRRAVHVRRARGGGG